MKSDTNILAKLYESILNSKSKKLVTINDSVGRGFINAMKLNGVSIARKNDPNAKIFTLNESNLLIESIQSQFSLKGGIIVFSTDVNAIYRGEGLVDKIKNWMKSKFESIKNLFLKNRKLTKVANKFDDVYGFSIGNFFRGRYKGNSGKTYDETSTSIEIIGIDSKTLIQIAEEIAKEFKQETVLVKDYRTHEIYLVDQD